MKGRCLKTWPNSSFGWALQQPQATCTRPNPKSTSGWGPTATMGPLQSWESLVQKATSFRPDFLFGKVLFHCFSRWIAGVSEPETLPPLKQLSTSESHFQLQSTQGMRCLHALEHSFSGHLTTTLCYYLNGSLSSIVGGKCYIKTINAIN